MDDLKALVDALVILNDDNLAQTVIDNDDVQWCLSELQDMLAADMEPVVRCKDCKWFADNNGGEWYGCKMFHVVRITPEDAPKPDDFCSYGERKNGGDSDAKSV